MRLVTIALVVLLGLVHLELWAGKGGVPRMMDLRRQLAAQKLQNEQAREHNEQLKAEVSDLKQGLEIIEERARYDLGMIKPDEILVQLTAPRH